MHLIIAIDGNFCSAAAEGAVTGLRTMMFSSIPNGLTKVKHLQHVQVLSI